MIIYVAECKRINFADREVKEKVRKYFGTPDQRDSYVQFVKGLWDTIECQEMLLDLPELRD